MWAKCSCNAVVVGALLLVGCSASLDLDESATIECSASDFQCPSGTECDVELRRCVSTGEPPPTAPTVSLGARMPGETERVTDELDFVVVFSDVNGDRLTVGFEACAEGSAESCFPASVVDASGAAVTTLSANSTATSATLTWQARADLVGRGETESTRTVDAGDGSPIEVDRLDASHRTYTLSVVFIDPVTGALDPSSYPGIEVGNDAPVAVVQESLIGSDLSDDIVIPVVVTDRDFDSTDVELEYQVEGEVQWRAPDIVLGSVAGVEGTVSEDPERLPPATVLVWASRSDDSDPLRQGIENTRQRVRFRTRARDFPDGSAHVGPWSETEFFWIENQRPPVILGLRADRTNLVGGTAIVPVFFTLADNDFDDLDIALEFSIDDGATYRPCVEYRGPESSGRFALATTTPDRAGIEHRFDWDPSGAFLSIPQSTVLRLTASDAAAENASARFEVTLARSVGPLVDPVTRTELPHVCSDSTRTDVEIADFNDDGMFDWFVACFDRLVLALGPNAGTSDQITTLTVDVFDVPLGNSVFDFATGDFNGDRRLDVVAMSRGGWALYYGNPDGSFATGQTFPSDLSYFGSDESDGLAVVDADNDGDPDFVSLGNLDDESRVGDIVLFTNQGGAIDSQFTSSVIATAELPSDLTAWEENGIAYLALRDGSRVDVSTIGDPATPVSAIEADGFPELDEMRMSDVSADGRLDLLAQQTSFVVGPNAIFVALGLGAGRFERFQAFELSQGPGGFDVADFNQDGAADIVSFSTAGRVELLLGVTAGGQPTGAFVPGGTLFDPDGSSFVRARPAVSTMNGEGRVIAPNARVGDEPFIDVTTATTDSVRGFATPVPSPALGRRDQVVSPEYIDVDFDGALDFIDRLGWSRGSPSGRLVAAEALLPGVDAHLAVFPFDQQPGRELVGVRGNAIVVEPLAPWLSGTIAHVEFDSTSLNLRLFARTAVCDTNGDELPDIVTTSGARSVTEGRNDVFVFRGAPSTDFAFESEPIRLQGARATEGLDCADVNLDGYDDLIVAEFSLNVPSLTQIFLSTPDATPLFRALEPIETGPSIGLVVAELNGDGLPDLVDVGRETFVLLGDGEGGLAVAQSFSGGPITDAAVADVNLDGALDIVLSVDTEVRVAFNSTGGGRATGAFSTPISLGSTVGSTLSLSRSFEGEGLVGADTNGDRLLDLGWLDADQWRISVATEEAAGTPDTTLLPLLTTPGESEIGWTPIAPRVEEPSLSPTLSRQPVQTTGPVGGPDILRDVHEQIGRGERWALASIPIAFEGDVHAPFVSDGSVGRRVFRYREEFEFVDPFVTEDVPKAWFTIDVPIFPAATGTLRVFRLSPRYRLANEYPGDALEGMNPSLPLLPRVEFQGEVLQILERLDRWEEILPGPLASAERSRFERRDNQVRIVSDRLGVFVVVEDLD